MATNQWYEREIRELLQRVSMLSTVSEVEALFEKIITPREINDMARRLKAAELLEQGQSYLEIQEKLGLSPVIIARISGHIGYGFRRTRPTKIKIYAKRKPAWAKHNLSFHDDPSVNPRKRI